MQKIRITILLVFIATLFTGIVGAGQYWIKVKATPKGPYIVDVAIETNIPGKIVLAVNLALKGQNPDKDVFIGTDFIRVPVLGGKAKTTVKQVSPGGSKLPKGNYYVEAGFYPRWSENEVAASAAKINDTIEGRCSVVLSASGQSSSSEQFKWNGQRWVMENWYPNYPWKPGFWRNKFGELQQVEYRGEAYRGIMKMYYIKSIDMTLMVNDLTKEIFTWRIGLEHK